MAHNAAEDLAAIERDFVSKCRGFPKESPFTDEAVYSLRFHVEPVGLVS